MASYAPYSKEELLCEINRLNCIIERQGRKNRAHRKQLREMQAKLAKYRQDEALRQSVGKRRVAIDTYPVANVVQ